MIDREPIQSPCTSVCQLDTVTGLCLGCWRTGDEIAAWSGLDNFRKKEIINALHERREKAGGRVRRTTLRNR